MYEKKINEKKGDGPWLLTEETLINIDSFMEKTYNNLIEWQKNTDENYEKKLIIGFNTGVTFECLSFKEALISGSISNQKPIKFEYVIDVGFNKVNIELDATSFSSYFSYYIRCKDSNLEDNVIYEMQKIFHAEKPRKIILLANKLGFMSFAVYGLIFLLLNAIMSFAYSTPLDNTIKNEVYQILSGDNLQQEDYFEIIRYMAIHDFKLYKLLENDDINTNFDVWKIMIWYLIIGFVFCIIITVHPKASFSIGTGTKKVKFWKAYYKMLFYFVPVIILLPIFINIISDIIMKNL